MTEVFTGAARWQVDEWLTSFYPEDLPTEWQMAYYANEFSTTLIECQTYCDAVRLDDLSEMLEDCHDGFRPIFSINMDEDTPDQAGHFFHWLDKIDSDMGIHRLAGVLLSVDAQIDNQALLDWRQCIPQALPVAFDGNVPFDTENRQWLAEMGISPVWRVDQPVISGQRYWLSNIPLTGDAPGLATRIRGFLGVISAETPACVVATSGYEEVSRLQELSTIVRLING